MELEFDKFYEERRHEREISSPLNSRTLLMAIGLHFAAFLLAGTLLALLAAMMSMIASRRLA